MTTSRAAARWAWIGVSLLTAAWVLGTAALVGWWFVIGLEGWADQHSNAGMRSAELARREVEAVLLMAVVAAGGPALIAVVAATGRLFRTGLCYLTLAVVISVIAVPVAVDAYSALKPAVPQPPRSTVCQDHSGGDTRCPGG